MFIIILTGFLNMVASHTKMTMIDRKINIS